MGRAGRSLPTCAGAAAALDASVDGLEVRRDSCPIRFEERREHELLAERRGVLVDGEPRAVSGDLEEHAIWLAQVETAEPEAVDLAAVGNRELVEARGPGVVVRVRRAEGDVMHAAGALLADGQVGLYGDVQFRVRATRAHLEDVDVPSRIVGWGVLASLSHVE